MRREVVNALVAQTVVISIGKEKIPESWEQVVTKPFFRLLCRSVTGLVLAGLLAAVLGWLGGWYGLAPGPGTRLQNAMFGALGVTTLFVIVPWFVFRWLHRCQHCQAIEGLRSVFFLRPPTRDEWEEAKRVIRLNGSELLEYGVELYFDDRCAI